MQLATYTLDCLPCGVLCQITRTPTKQWADHVTGWQSWTTLPAVFSCAHPGMTVPLPTIRGGGGLSRARHKSPPAISPIILCAGFPLHHQPDAEQRPCHKSSSNRTQLIYIALANYVNICKKTATAEGCHIVQCGGDLEYCYAIVLGIFNK